MPSRELRDTQRPLHFPASPPEILVSKLGRPTVSIWCTMSDTSALDKKAPDLLPDKNKPIIAFCAVGGRSNEARKKLREMGYGTVLNAGGLKDMGYIK